MRAQGRCAPQDGPGGPFGGLRGIGSGVQETAAPAASCEVSRGVLRREDERWR
jgi:hypothetical protein